MLIYLKDILFSVHQKYPPTFKIEYFKRQNSRNLNYPMKIIKEKLFKFYETLIKHCKIDDAVLLHAMYFLGLEPYNLCLLKFESIKENKTVKMWDHKSRKLITINISNNLFNKFKYLQLYKQKKDRENTNQKRYSLDGVKVVKKFIFSS